MPENLASLPDGPTLPVEQLAIEGGSSSILDSGALRVGESVPSIPVPSSVKGPDFSNWGTTESLPDATNTDTESEQKLDQPLDDAMARPVELSSVSREKPVASIGARPSGVSRSAFYALVVYASVATAIALGLMLYLLTMPRRELESLPDVVPPIDAEGEISHVLVPADAPLPPGHVLALGETQRFGDLRVTPLKVTREAIRFAHYRGEGTRESSDEVLKLWLKFENVGRDEKRFAPLDGELLFYRKNGGSQFKANNFVAPSASRDWDDLIPVYDHPVSSDWDLAEQNLGTLLAPGESVITFIPSATDVTASDGSLAWRVHFRKGIASNGWGVTTLVEIVFDADAIQES